jgi:hypothetical protein
MNQFSERDNLGVGVREIINIGQNSFFYDLVVRYHRFDGINAPVRPVMNVEIGGNVYPFYMAKLRKQLSPALSFSLFCFTDCLTYFEGRLFTVSDYHNVKELCDRLGIEASGASSDDEGIFVTSILSERGYTGEIKHIEDVGVREFMLETEPYNVKACEGAI